MRNLQRPRRQSAAELRQRAPDVRSRQLAELLPPDQVHQRLHAVPVQRYSPFRPTAEPAGEPFLHRSPDGVAGRRRHPHVEIGVQRLQLRPDLGLALAPDLAADPLPVAAIAKRGL